MSELAVIPHDPAAIEAFDDPASAMVALVDRARTMLAQATGMEGLADVIEWKSRAEAIRVYTQQKDMGHEAELSAAEIVRRAERRIVQLIREGQAVGEILTKGQRADLLHEKNLTTEFLPVNGQAKTEMYALTDHVSDEQFDAALAEARSEGNVSRKNIVRKLKPTTAQRIAQASKNNPVEPPRNLPLAARAQQIRELAESNYTSVQIADAVGVSPDRVRDIAKRAGIDIAADAVFKGRFRKVDPNRVIDSIVENANPEATALAFVAYSELDRDRLEEWASSLGVAIKSLTTIRKSIQKELTREQA